MSPKLSIELERDVMFKSIFDDNQSPFILRGKLIFTPSTPIKVQNINLCFKGSLVMRKGRIQSCITTLIDHKWDFHQNLKLFCAGEYVYDFELALPADLPDSLYVDYASIQYHLKAMVETPLFASNLKTDREVYIHQDIGAMMSAVCNTHIENTWKDMVDYEIIIPKHEYIPSDTIPITFKHNVRGGSCKLISVWAGVYEITTYKDPGDYPAGVNCCINRFVSTLLKNISRDAVSSTLSLGIDRSYKNVHFDSTSSYVEVSHQLQTKITVELDGRIRHIKARLPICIVRKINNRVTHNAVAPVEIELLPEYEAIHEDNPPSYPESLGYPDALDYPDPLNYPSIPHAVSI
ncbi:hypothetical protein K7432_004460 [Basidiobolus ranarum]|uniref:Arrestin C-terminal-like domain-containing protein n=1 Tax=Basidiobolus ranarum TaxID=34480 RepID=A0ABR2W522_9FUNG